MQASILCSPSNSISEVENMKEYNKINCDALILGGVPSEIHIYREGPHCLSVATMETGNADPHIAHWIRDCTEWTKLVSAAGGR